MRLRLFAALAAMAVLLGAMVVPAAANPGIQALVLIVGEATFCADNGAADEPGGVASCTVAPDEKKGIPSDTSGNGLYLPFFQGAMPGDFTKRVGWWGFSSETGIVSECVGAGPVKADTDVLSTLPIPPAIADVHDLMGEPVLDLDCVFTGAGRLGPALGIGAACGVSHGYHGEGLLILDAAPTAPPRRSRHRFIDSILKTSAGC